MSLPLLQNFLKHGDQEYTHKKLGLERVREALAALGHPERAYPSVLIAGTNGKGSVGRMLEAVLLEAEYPVGLYTSPHLISFQERIRVGGKEVSTNELESILQIFQHKGLLQPSGEMLTPAGETLTWFEKTTLLALEIFRRRQVPLALLEVGLGGRLDATNAVEPLLSIITSISLDHAEVLGDSLFEIAAEKLAVCRPGKPLVLGSMAEEVRTFLNKGARMLGAQPIVPHEPLGDWGDFSYGPFQHLKLGMAGRHQLKNAAVVLETLVVLKGQGFEVDNRHVRAGLAQAQNPGRLHVLEGRPEIVFDGAHNPEAFQALVDFLRVKNSGQKMAIVFGMVQGKEPMAAVKILNTLQPKWVFTQVPHHPRSLPLKAWEEIVRIKKLEAEFIAEPREALEKAKEVVGPEGTIVVTGSLYLVGELMAALGPTIW